MVFKQIRKDRPQSKVIGGVCSLSTSMEPWELGVKVEQGGHGAPTTDYISYVVLLLNHQLKIDLGSSLAHDVDSQLQTPMHRSC